MGKLVLGSFLNIDQVSDVIKELQGAGVPRKDFSIVANTEKSAQAAQSTESALLAGGIVGILAGLTLGALAVANMSADKPLAWLLGIGWIALYGILGSIAGSIVGALVAVEVPETDAFRDEMPLATFGSALLGVEDNQASEDEIRNAFARHGADQVATVEHDRLNAKLVSATGR